MLEIDGECIVFFLVFFCFVLVRPRPKSHSVLFTDMVRLTKGSVHISRM